MSIQYTTAASPEALCNALRDVLAVEFNAENPSELAAAAVLTQKLMGNSDIANILAERIAKYGLDAQEPNFRLRGSRSFQALRKPKLAERKEEISWADFPSEATSERNTTEKYSKQPVSHLLALDPDPGFFTGGDLLAHRNNLLVFYSPEVLGFPAETATVSWSVKILRKWDHFLQLAANRIVTSVSAGTNRSKVTQRTWPELQNDLVFSSQHKAKNYSIVEHKAGIDRTAVHVLFEPDTLYVVATFNEETTLRSKVHEEDLDVFVKEIVGAFGGHKGNAKSALTSLRFELIH